jgi:hypothetical protein
MEAAYKLSGHRGREGMLRKAVELYWLIEMYVSFTDWMQMFK